MNALVVTVMGLSALAQTPAPIQPRAEQEVEASAPRKIASVQEFEAELAPHGDWLEVHQVRAFRPARRLVGSSFVPYASLGQWVWTEAGWTFSTSLPFGWATFHYGRWWLDPTYGWVWVPDTTWGPAWVDWRDGGGYAGWTPQPPPAFARLYHRPRWFFVDAPSLASAELTRHEVASGDFDAVLRATSPSPALGQEGAVKLVAATHRVVPAALATPVRRARAPRVADLLAPAPRGY